jgi:hypothetical protein
MKRTALSLLALCVLLLPACSGGAQPSTAGRGTVSAERATSAPQRPSPTAAPAGLVVTVTDEGGRPAPGASVSLTDMAALAAVTAAAGAGGRARLGEQAGSRYLLVSAPGFLDAGSDIALSGGYRNVAVRLKPAVSVKRFLMAVTAVSAGDGKSRVYLAQSDDGVAWEPFPGFAPFEDTGGAGVAAKDGMVYVCTETAIQRYRVATGEWDVPRTYAAQAGKKALTREPSLFIGPSGALTLVAAHTRGRAQDYADSGLKADSGSEISLVGIAEECVGSLGLIFGSGAQRYLYKDQYSLSQFRSRDISSPFVVAAPGAYYLLLSKAAGVAAHQSAAGDAGYKPVASLKDGLVYAGANSGATGYWDAAAKRFVLVVSVNAGGSAALRRYELESLAAPAAGEACDIDLGFLGGAAASVACPVIWDTAVTGQAAASPAVPAGFGAGWSAAGVYPGDRPGRFTGSDAGAALSLPEKSHCVLACRQALMSVFTLSADFLPAAGAVQGLAYCWDPAGAGGYVFAVDGRRWSLSLLRPAAGAKGSAELASGECPESASPCTLAVRCGMGRHALYVNGKKVGEYRDTEELPGFGAGYAGLYAASGDRPAEFKFTPVRIKN